MKKLTNAEVIENLERLIINMERRNNMLENDKKRHDEKSVDYFLINRSQQENKEVIADWKIQLKARKEVA